MTDPENKKRQAKRTAAETRKASSSEVETPAADTSRRSGESSATRVAAVKQVLENRDNSDQWSLRVAAIRRVLESRGPSGEWLGRAASVKRALGTINADSVSQTYALSADKRYQDLLREKTELEQRLVRSIKELAGQREVSQEKQLALTQTLEALQAKEKLGFVLSRVNESAQQLLLQSEDFRNKFLKTKQCQAFVMSVDIRRSTELMLKARTPEDFSHFITSLCEDLRAIIVNSLGVFDKFTGDGVLAFFPDFYSGEDVAYRVIATANSCHEAFNRHYHTCRKSFTSILTDVGLGIGVDFGLVHLVNIAEGLTVVGVPVVYACRLSGAPPGRTLLNQPAYEQVIETAGPYCFIDETEIDIKHEGTMLAYDIRPNARGYKPKSPSWWSDGGSSSEIKAEPTP